MIQNHLWSTFNFGLLTVDNPWCQAEKQCSKRFPTAPLKGPGRLSCNCGVTWQSIGQEKIFRPPLRHLPLTTHPPSTTVSQNPPLPNQPKRASLTKKTPENVLKQWKKHIIDQPTQQAPTYQPPRSTTYPLVICYITMENHHWNSGFSQL